MELCMWSGYFKSMTPEDAIVRLVKNDWKYTEFSSEHADRLLERGALKEIGYTGVFNLEIGGEAGRCPDFIKDVKLEYLKKIMHLMFEQN